MNPHIVYWRPHTPCAQYSRLTGSLSAALTLVSIVQGYGDVVKDLVHLQQYYVCLGMQVNTSHDTHTSQNPSIYVTCVGGFWLNYMARQIYRRAEYIHMQSMYIMYRMWVLSLHDYILVYMQRMLCCTCCNVGSLQGTVEAVFDLSFPSVNFLVDQPVCLTSQRLKRLVCNT